MTDADLEIRAEVDHSDPKMGGRGEGGPVSKKNFASVSSDSKAGSDPRVPPLDPPLREGRCMLESLSVSFVTG